MNRHYHVRDIMAMTIDERLMLPDGGLYLTFDDGEEGKYKTRSTILSAYYWDLVNMFPGLEIKKHHHQGNDDYTADTHNTFGSLIFWHTYYSQKNQTQQLVWDMTRELYLIVNRIYNTYATKLLPWVSTMDIDDMMQILFHPVTIEAKRRHKAGEIDLDTAHDIIYSLMSGNDPELKFNQVRCACAAGLLSRRQIKQMIGPRGAIPDVNGETFDHIIYPGYMEGLDTFYDSFTEMRTASIALYATSAPLEASEYNNRQCQLACSVFRKITYGDQSDCGGKHTLNIVVDDLVLPTLAGKNVQNDDGTVTMLTGKEKNLIGKEIKLRSINKCSNSDPQTVCLTCVGQNGLTVPPGTTAGHHLCIEPQEKISQTILSTKHVIASAVALALNIKEGNREKFLIRDEEDKFIIRLKEKKNPIKIRVHKTHAMFLNDIFAVEEIEDVRINGVSDIPEIQICEINPETNVIATIDRVSTEVAGKGSPLSTEFLAYLKEHRWELVGKHLEFDLSEWDFDKPFMRTNPISADIMALFNSFKTFIHAPKDSTAPKITDHTTVESASIALCRLLAEKLSINFTHVEVFIKPLMAKGQTGYALPRPDDEFRFITIKEAIQNRGMGNALGFQEQHQLLTDPEAYNRAYKELPGSGLDDLWSTQGIMPGE